MSDLQFVSWKEIFIKAMEEKDSKKAARLLHEADLAIFHREQQLNYSPMHREELSAIAVALEAMRVTRHALNAQDKSAKGSNANETTGE